METKQILKQASKNVAATIEMVDPAQIDALAEGIAKAKRVFVAGWGRAGNVVRILGMDMSQIGKLVYCVGDNSTPSIHEGDILVVFSGSGNTKTISIIAEEAKAFGAELGLISGNAKSIIGEMADYNVVIPECDCPMNKLFSEKMPVTDPHHKGTAGTRVRFDISDEERALMTMDQSEILYQAGFVLNEVIQQKVMELIGEEFEAPFYYHNSLE